MSATCVCPPVTSIRDVHLDNLKRANHRSRAVSLANVANLPFAALNIGPVNGLEARLKRASAESGGCATKAFTEVGTPLLSSFQRKAAMEFSHRPEAEPQPAGRGHGARFGRRPSRMAGCETRVAKLAHLLRAVGAVKPVVAITRHLQPGRNHPRYIECGRAGPAAPGLYFTNINCYPHSG